MLRTSLSSLSRYCSATANQRFLQRNRAEDQLVVGRSSYLETCPRGGTGGHTGPVGGESLAHGVAAKTMRSAKERRQLIVFFRQPYTLPKAHAT